MLLNGHSSARDCARGFVDQKDIKCIHRNLREKERKKRRENLMSFESDLNALNSVTSEICLQIKCVLASIFNRWR